MASSRYNFCIHAKVKVGRLIGLSFFTARFNDDAAAIAFAEWLEPLMANYATISVSKVVREAGSYEIPTEHTIEDTEDRKYVLVHTTAGGTVDPDLRMFLTIPGLKATADTGDIVNQGMQNAAGDKAFNTLATGGSLGKNVIEGGPY